MIQETSIDAQIKNQTEYLKTIEKQYDDWEIQLEEAEAELFQFQNLIQSVFGAENSINNIIQDLEATYHKISNEVDELEKKYPSKQESSPNGDQNSLQFAKDSQNTVQDVQKIIDQLNQLNLSVDSLQVDTNIKIIQEKMKNITQIMDGQEAINVV
ncbi:hypothetical protein TRFO_21606 [Tritrichomonas foetus]|uniref:Uncharacterized protein n=1 Tax=Tritrichomonas foetus TaxID=1144522 RepID=A0A1J4KEC8_9EUKA|nr:hypothetical protein TRFO_21606 [Tritrichomonas foetus]|eukprot:OHT09547.1 hypothetical protein TRFO_21606 [Tritrichomonas foetus]